MSGGYQSSDCSTASTTERSATDRLDLLHFQLLSIWRNALDLTDIEVNDHFFDLGGDSFAAEGVCDWMKEFLHLDLPVSAIHRAPTIERLARLIRKTGWSEQDVDMVAIELRGSRPPLFCFPGAAGDGISFRHLSRYLGDDQPCFSFQPQWLNGPESFYFTVETMATRYLEVLRKHRPSGPYHLCGCSFGGVVIVEMARRLIEQGESVLFIGLLDSYGSDYPRPRNDLPLLKKLRLSVQHVPSIANTRFGWSFITKGLPEWWQLRCVRSDLGASSPRRARSHVRRFFYIREACFFARRRHGIRPLKGKIHLFRVEAQPRTDLFETDPFLGWAGAASEGIEVHDLPGCHGCVMVEPDVRVLAAKLAASLAEARRSKLPISEKELVA